MKKETFISLFGTFFLLVLILLAIFYQVSPLTSASENEEEEIEEIKIEETPSEYTGYESTEPTFDLTIEKESDLTFQELNESWSPELTQVGFASTMDNEIQEAVFHSATEEAPLVISLHQWRANYRAFDPMSEIALEQDWNYIRPNFRGPNNRPEAGGSEYVVSDIDDAISFAVKYGNVDVDNIFVIGASGGGHAALMHLMNSQLPVARYSVWVPITDLIAWYGESRVRDRDYYQDIMAITESTDQLNVHEARRRSPIYQEPPIERLQETDVHIFAGVNDGYEGSVPISHSINFYNMLISELEYGEEYEVPYNVEAQLIYTQSLFDTDNQENIMLGDRQIIYQTASPTTALTIFDGDHEILHDKAFGLLSEPFE